MKRSRRALLALLVIALGYSGWCWQSGRLAEGPRGLLHPTGDYWVSKALRGSCFAEQSDGRGLGVRISVAGDERQPELSVETATVDHIRVRGTIERNPVHKDTPSDRFETTMPIVLPVEFSGQPVYLNDAVLPSCTT